MGSPRTYRSDLYLRAERAFGLKWIRAGQFDSDPFDSESRQPVHVQRIAQGVRNQMAQPPRNSGSLPSAKPPSKMTKSGSEPVAPMLVTALPMSAAPVLDRNEKIRRLSVLDETQVQGCVKCRLSETRTQTVFGEGDPDAAIFFVGEGPGENEDKTGRPFVGRAGQLLEKMIVAMGLTRQQVYIANIVKCRPPGNRAPAPDETAACTPFLVSQIDLVRPQVIVTLGHPAAKFMLETKESMGRLRGNWKEWRGIPLMPTFHPSYVLRSYTTEVRAAVWSDLQQVMEKVGLQKQG